MFDGPAINELITLLERRGVSLYHACQFGDFCAYLRLGGIPSRALLEGSRQRFTPFETDVHDRQNGVWDKVFVNLADFGEWFAHGFCAVPNPYGPIVLQLRPAALRAAADVAVCGRSAGAADFDRRREALGRVEDVDRLFLNAADAGFPRSAYLKMATPAPSPGPAAGMPEVSCTTPRGLLPLDDVIVAWTDPYVLGGRPLRAWVGEAMAAAGPGFGYGSARAMRSGGRSMPSCWPSSGRPSRACPPSPTTRRAARPCAPGPRPWPSAAWRISFGGMGTIWSKGR